MPVYWHFHWQLPKQVKPLARQITIPIYAVAVLLAGAEWLCLLPTTLYLLGFLLALLGSLIVLALHFIRLPNSRADLIPLGIAALLALGLPILVVAAAVSGISWQAFLVGFLSLPLLPLTYFYVAYRQQEVRANQVATLYLYVLFVGTALVVVVPTLDRWLNVPGSTLLIAIATTFSTTLFTLFGYGQFRRFVERYILRIPITPTDLLHVYAERVAVSSTQAELVQLLTHEVLPSLFIRQSALYIVEAGTLQVIYTRGLGDIEPSQAQLLPTLPAPHGRSQASSAVGNLADAPQWVRLPLVLTIAGKPIGLWLLGQRDPEDHYPADIIEILIAIANQTAIAVSNLALTDRVRVLSQVNLEQTEVRRADLARDLHDNLLQVLAHLETNLDERTTPPRVFELLDSLVVTIRQTISDLRPPILDYGLRLALESLADSLSLRTSADAKVNLQPPPDEVRYDLTVELHLYRIVQQACENALQHAEAQLISIEGNLEPGRIELTIRDNGRGFEIQATPNLVTLVAHKHYGLAGMMERAEIIGATLQIKSERGQGTEIRVNWTRSGLALD